MVSVYEGITLKRKIRIWSIWQRRAPMGHIAQAIKKPPATVYSYLLYHGGIKPKTRVRRSNCLAFEERESISPGIASGLRMRAIARDISRNLSTICREITRNGGLKRYRASLAEKTFLKNGKRPKLLLLGGSGPLREKVANLLEQSSIDGKQMRASHETIYRSLFIRTRGLFKKELKSASKPSAYPPCKVKSSGNEGPAEIEDRSIPNRWKGDLIIDSKNNAIVTVVERYSRFTVLCKIDGKRATSAVETLTKQMKRLLA